MIPRTFPSILEDGKTKCVVYVLPSISGLQAWKDYIPVKGVTTENTAVENTYANDGYIVMKTVDGTQKAWIDYLPVYEDASYNKAWSTDAGGYIPASGLFTVRGTLFANSEPGVWYDPSDMSTLFQDAAGTTPVTAVEQPVGLMLDKSGNNLHATQSTSTSRPVLKQDANGKYYLFFDGVDDWMVTPTITPGIDKVQVFAGVRKLLVSGTATVAELSASLATNTNAFRFMAPTVTASYNIGSRGTSSPVGANSPLAAFPAPTTDVLTGISDISGDVVTLRVNGVLQETNTADQGGTDSFGNYPLYIGRRGGASFPFNGHLYSLITRFGTNLSTATIEAAEKYVAQKTGITI